MTLLAVRHSSQLLGLINKIQSDCEMLNEKVQKYDKEVSRIYHEIELKVLNEKEALDISIRLQNALKLRRKTKYELTQLRNMLKSIGCNKLKMKVKMVKEKIMIEEHSYIETYPLYKNIIQTDYHKISKEGARGH